MEYQVMWKSEGMNFASEVLNEIQKNNFIQIMKNGGFDYQLLTRDDRLWHCAKVVFDIQLIDAARKAIKENKDMDGVYTFGDPNCLAKEDKVVKVECTDGRVKNAYVVGIWLATADEIKEFKARIKYPKLGLVK